MNYINAELEARGISDITTEEVIIVWDRIVSLDTSQVVVLRALPLNVDEDLPHPIREDISPRRAAPISQGSSYEQTDGSSAEESKALCGPEMEKYLSGVLGSVVAATIGINETDIDLSLALSEMEVPNFRRSGDVPFGRASEVMIYADKRFG
ncbi:hypothetical protein SLS53_009367 [Cytospora paraplurivora]|uniref:Uncharacterized protein n=1 Tax=Cytospora paraplurivora TaxID=2898453 RepID=A0AAN9TVA3_9PEZI